MIYKLEQLLDKLKKYKEKIQGYTKTSDGVYFFPPKIDYNSKVRKKSKK